MMSPVQESEYDTQLVGGIRSALAKARELGYDVEDMDVTASLSEGVCSVHFTPVPAPGFLVAGGDLTVKIDSRTGDVVRYERGQ